MDIDRIKKLAGIIDIPGVNRTPVSTQPEMLNESEKERKFTEKSGYVSELEKVTESNTNFRKVLYTTENSQLVLMSLKPNEDIGMEIHDNGDQFIRVDKGEAESSLDGKKSKLKDGDAIVVTKGTEHNVTNTSSTERLQLYVVYSPPQHKDGTVDKNKPAPDEDDV